MNTTICVFAICITCIIITLLITDYYDTKERRYHRERIEEIKSINKK